MKKVFRLERGLARAVRPLATAFSPVPLPDDRHFEAIERMSQRLKGVDRTLTDPDITTVRLVTSPEKMVLRETQRLFMYLNLYAMTVDMVVVNRILDGEGAAFANTRLAQRRHLADLEDHFAGTPLQCLPWLDQEILGIDRLAEVAGRLYPSADPAARLAGERPYAFAEDGAGYRLSVRLPSASREHVDLYRNADELIVRIGSFKRSVPLPRALQRLSPARARFEGDRLLINFPRPGAPAESRGGADP